MSRILASLLIVALARGVVIASEPAVAAPGANFYGQEQWEPGKLRRWMNNDGELHLRNDGGAAHVDLRFLAESFRIPRILQVRMGGRTLLEAAIPPAASLYVVVKGIPLESGESTLVLSAFPGPDQVSRYLKSDDQREVSLAFGPFSTIDAATPEAQHEQTAAFPRADRSFPQLSPLENAAGNLRREGRLLEAWDAYRAALASDRIHPTTYPFAGLTLVALDRLDDARPVFARGSRVEGGGLAAGYVQRLCTHLLDYLDHSELLAQRASDPGREYRQRGEIYRAVLVYWQALARDPQDLVASYWLGLLTALAERRSEAAPLFDTVVARSRPDSADAQMVRELQHYMRSP